MVYDDSNEKINRFAHGIIRRKTNQLIGQAGIRKQDRVDIQQELTLRLLQRWPYFNPNRAHRNVFTTTVIERFVATILRDKRAQKRDDRRVASLNVTVNIGEDEPAELGDTVSQRELDAQRGRSPRGDEELTQLRQDLAEIIARTAQQAEGAGRAAEDGDRLRDRPRLGHPAHYGRCVGPQTAAAIRGRRNKRLPLNSIVTSRWDRVVQ